MPRVRSEYIPVFPPTPFALHRKKEEAAQREIGLTGEVMDLFKTLQIRFILMLAVNLGMLVSYVLIAWKGLICITGVNFPVTVVLSESMEPSFKRGDILILLMTKDPIRSGQIVVFEVARRKTPIVHRVIRVHERQENGEVDVLTKGDNNYMDDRFLYPHDELWLQKHHIFGRPVWIFSDVGWPAIAMIEHPMFKVCFFGVTGLLYMLSFY